MNREEETQHRLGRQAGKDGDYDLAVSLLKPLADKGNLKAMNDLSVIYNLQGKDLETYELRKQVVDQVQNVISLYNYAKCFYYGTGVEKDYKKAIKYFKKSAEAGYIPACERVATMYLEGQGTLVSKRNAVKYAKLGAKFTIEQNSNDYSCLTLLGRLYMHNGEPVMPNYKKAYYYYNEASKRGDPIAKFEMASMILFEEYKGDKDEAIKLLEAASYSKYKTAIELLIETYLNGWFGFERNTLIANYWIKYGEKIKHPLSMLLITKDYVNQMMFKEASEAIKYVDEKQFHTQYRKDMYKRLKDMLDVKDPDPIQA